MTITLIPELETALTEAARRRGVSPEFLALGTLQSRFLTEEWLKPQDDEWERGLFEAARDCSVSLPDSALSGEGLYE